MIIAREKRKKNIAEYVLYMWQLEDTLRALKFDMNLIDEKLVSQFKQSEKIQDEIRNWYANIILAMHEEGIKEQGHLKIIQGVTEELYELHKRLINEVKDPSYIEAYNQAKSNIDAFRVKLDKTDANEVELCFYALYGLLMLRLKKQNISELTQQAMNTFSNLLAHLSTHYKNIEEGKSEF